MISHSYFPVEEGCKLPSEPCYSISPSQQTQQLFRGHRIHRKNQS